jgi:hypothetical protein
VFTPHPHDCCKKPDVKAAPAFKPLDTLNKDEKMLAQLAVQVEALEKQKAEAEAENDKGKGKAGKDAVKAPAATAPAPPAAKKP